MEDKCISCGEVIPEGRQICIMCERRYREGEDTPKRETVYINIEGD